MTSFPIQQKRRTCVTIVIKYDIDDIKAAGLLSWFIIKTQVMQIMMQDAIN